MKIHHAIAGLLIIPLLFLAGCLNIDYSLPENPIQFYTGTFVNPNHAENQYLSIEYNGRTYISYDGSLKGSFSPAEIGHCIGYIVREDFPDDLNLRVCLFTEDSEVNYLLTYYVNGVMETPSLYRAIDTVGQDISTPSCIESYSSEYYAALEQDPGYASYWKPAGSAGAQSTAASNLLVR